MITPYVPLVLRENLEKVGNPRHKKSVGNEFVSALWGPVGQKCRLLAVGLTCCRHVGDIPSQGSEALMDHIADFLKFMYSAQSFWFSLNTSYNHGCHLASHFRLDPDE